MSVPLIGEIQMFVGNYAPRNWAICDGSILSISENTALFAVIGNAYGGDGRVTFALPDLRGRVPIGAGTGPGLSTRIAGQRSGAEAVLVTEASMPTHTHAVTSQITVDLKASTSQGNTVSPAGGAMLCKGYDIETTFEVTNYIATPSGTEVTLGGTSITGSTEVQTNGGSAFHENMMPWQAVNYIIAITGIFPARND